LSREPHRALDAAGTEGYAGDVPSTPGASAGSHLLRGADSNSTKDSTTAELPKTGTITTTSVRRLLPLALLSAAASAAAVPAWAQSLLFDSNEVLELRIASDFKRLMANRDSLQLETFPGTMSYAAADGQPVPVQVGLRLRGHWRRQKQNCDFAPIKVDFPKGARSGTIFEGQGDLKLVVHCQKGERFQQYVLREYLVYRLYNILTPVSHRARLVRAWYVDTSGRGDSLLAYAFFLESDRKAAERNGARLVETMGARWEHLDPDHGALVSAFEYLIGGSDWLLPGLHNIILFRHQETGAVLPVAYDFDWTGIVNTGYAFPDYRLPISSVRERYYRGICRTAEEWAPVLARFRGAREALYAVYDSVPGIDPRYVGETREYLDRFFEVIGEPGRLKRAMIDRCQAQ
jgi:hypothetical protein